jgi:hypothetical protein
MGGKGQGFCDNSTTVFVIKTMSIGEGVGGQKLSEIAWYHLWTTPWQKYECSSKDSLSVLITILLIEDMVENFSIVLLV